MFTHSKLNIWLLTSFLFCECAGIRKFVYVSVHDYNFPDFLKNVGYFTGKKRAEAEVLAKFTTTGKTVY